MPYSSQAQPEPTREEVDRMTGPVLLEFGASWCPHCQGVQPELAALLGQHQDWQHIKIEDGKGEFSGVDDISEILGTYVAAEAHAGAAKSSTARVMTKGEVTLALAGKGRGWDVGVAFGKFVISRR